MLFLRAPPHGKYPVGATTFILPVNYQEIGHAKLHSANSLKPALSLEEVAFTVYYPAHVGNKTRYGLDWLPRPLSHSVRGYATFGQVSAWLVWPIFYLFGSLIKIPVHTNAPVLDPSTRLDNSRRAWPLVIFSHGLGGGRTTYSEICTRIAASGKIVLAMEHRDGTSPVVVDSRGDPKLYIREEEPVWEPNIELGAGPMPFRADQLLFRHHEICQAYTAFRRLVNGGRKCSEAASSITTIDGTNVDWNSWEKAVECDGDVSLVGHSFGGATLMSILSNPPPDNIYPALPVARAIALDPWLEPLPSPGPVPYSAPSIISAPTPLASNPPSSHSISEFGTTTQTARPRLLVINGEGFTLWEEHFERLGLLMRMWAPEGRRLLTVVRAYHHYFSDVYMLPILRRHVPTASPVMDVIEKLCVAFLEDRLEEGLEGVKTRPMEIEWFEEKGKSKQRLVGDVADVVVH